MPLDEQVVALLSRRAEMGAVPIESLSVDEARTVFEQSVLSAGADVSAVEDVAVSAGSRQIAVRVYRPAPEVCGPVVVFLHGGGWALGDVATYDPLCRQLAATLRCVLVAVDYRRAPEDPFPAAFEDAYAVTAWLAAQLPALGLTGGVIVLGDSSGANLAAAVALAARDRRGPDLAAQVLVYPLTDPSADSASLRLFSTGYLLHTSAITWFWDHYLQRPEDADDPYASPLRAPDLAGLPPTLIITAEFDPVRDEAEAYGAALAAAGNDVVVSRYDGMVHGFVQMPSVLDRGRDAIAEIADYVTAVGRRPGGARPDLGVDGAFR